VSTYDDPDALLVRSFWVLAGWHPPKSDFSRVIDMATSVRSLVDPEGNKTDVVVSWAAWEELLTWLEQADDRAIVREWLPRLKAGPDKSGALRWSDVADE